MTSSPLGPTEAAVAADLERYDLERFPTAGPLAASARVLARRLDQDPTAAVARELRLILDALARVTIGQQADAVAEFIEGLSLPVGEDR